MAYTKIREHNARAVRLTLWQRGNVGWQAVSRFDGDWLDPSTENSLWEVDVKAMTCRQLGGACDLEFRADSFEEMTELSKRHGLEMHQKQDEAHIEAMNAMKELMQKPDAMRQWFQARKAEFASLPDL